ncbi:AraC family transcriptional regulator [Thalassospira marina]|uniref:AraC family transcriptional regulator n=1 Tax=Thalassospira marina TaxID=2048283 RepID=A0ABN5FD78_9PROT|nr:helix-turn-helix transcriptional regulator [Thalassospira marina]AUG52768.1 AraC family transcriptional regulator [Thalassospira marina]
MSSFPDVDRPVIGLGMVYEDGEVIPPHDHDRDQLLYGMTGVVIASSEQGVWLMPPQRGMWIPAGIVHEVRMIGKVIMRSLYLSPDESRGMPDQCQVVGISPLMRSLLSEAVSIAPEYDVNGRDGALMALIEHEIRNMPAIPLSLPLPLHKALSRRCHAFIRTPSAHDTIENWCNDLGMSRRSFTRLFRMETGLSFVEWRQQACTMAALPRLAAGEAVTTIALDLGYDNPAAFTSMFKRILGASPRDYRQ